MCDPHRICHALSLGSVLFLVPCGLAKVAQGMYKALLSWRDFRECSVASAVSENHMKAYPVLAQFLEAAWQHILFSENCTKTGSGFTNSCQVLVKAGMASKVWHVTFDTRVIGLTSLVQADEDQKITAILLSLKLLLCFKSSSLD